MIKLLLAGAIAAAGLAPAALPNPGPNECFLVGNDMVESEPTFTQPDTKITDLTLFQICGEMHPGETPGEFVQRDEFKVLVLDQRQAELLARAAQDWLDQGLISPDQP